MLDVRFTGQFKKDLAKVEKQNKQVDKLYEVIDLLRQEKPLPDKNQDHPLIGEWAGCRECHIDPDWLLIYKTTDAADVPIFQRNGVFGQQNSPICFFLGSSGYLLVNTVSKKIKQYTKRHACCPCPAGNSLSS